MRHFEDFTVGETDRFGSVTMTRAEIVAFAEEYDPQPFHTDAERARESRYGGLIASGLHTFAVTTRLMTEHLTADAAFVGAMGIDELRWPAPVRPGETVSVETRVSRTEERSPQTGLVEVDTTVHGDDDPVLGMRPLLLFDRRETGSGTDRD
ncbi:MaoC/PaaZ C-terminal domain-containing protein [Halopenitus sp. POP-27]|uniref:MaoC/PaaZ C-terminal domain-containing protein n=1 Tax=Halopenitus sp. POP-27 TaxID=2994425 RepID=UPI0024694892|nr:MaoC/PaaZ C-terminal domain-containing protein [Halopenitus sp. POP-27]